MSAATDRATARRGRVPAYVAIPLNRALATIDHADLDSDQRAAWWRVKYELSTLSAKLQQARADVVEAEDRMRGAFTIEYVRELRAEAAGYRRRLRDLEGGGR